MICERTKAVGLACSSDQECDLVCLMLFFFDSGLKFRLCADPSVQYNCGPAGVCAYPPETPLRVAPWQYVITAICIVGGA